MTGQVRKEEEEEEEGRAVGEGWNHKRKYLIMVCYPEDTDLRGRGWRSASNFESAVFELRASYSRKSGDGSPRYRTIKA